MSKAAPRVLIAAGGTGGHIFPALHVARAIMERAPQATVAFIGSGRPLEAKLIDPHGFSRFVLPAQRIMQEGPLGLIRFCLNLPLGIYKVWKLFREFKPDVVVGMGGYVTVLPITVARFTGVSSWVHEAEIQPGLANKVLGVYAQKVSVAFKETKMMTGRSVIVTGHPVRPELAGIAEMSPPQQPRNLLIVGGSQGARAIDEAVEGRVSELQKIRLNIRHQTREDNVDRLKRAYASVSQAAEVSSFITDMPEAYRWADIIISRAGAGALAELSVVNRPSILVPYPFAQGGHQKGNAMVLVNAGKAVLVEEGAGFPDRLLAELQSITEPRRYGEMRARPVSKDSLGAAGAIADGILATIR